MPISGMFVRNFQIPWPEVDSSKQFLPWLSLSLEARLQPSCSTMYDKPKVEAAKSHFHDLTQSRSSPRLPKNSLLEEFSPLGFSSRSMWCWKAIRMIGQSIMGHWLDLMITVKQYMRESNWPSGLFLTGCNSTVIRLSCISGCQTVWGETEKLN